VTFFLEIPHYVERPFQLTGSGVYVSSLVGDKSPIIGQRVGTVVEDMGLDSYDEGFGIDEVGEHIARVFAKLMPEPFELLKRFSFHSKNGNDRGWFDNFNIHTHDGELEGVIPTKNIDGYFVHPSMIGEPMCNYMHTGWYPTQAWVEYLTRRSREFNVNSKFGMKQDEGITIRSDDTLTVVSFVRGSKHPFSRQDIEELSKDRKTELEEIILQNGYFALVDEVAFPQPI
jgi:hypothetical protein